MVCRFVSFDHPTSGFIKFFVGVDNGEQLPSCWAVRPVHYRTEQLFQFRKSQNYSSKGNRRNRMELECNYWTDPTAVYHMYAKKMA